MTTVLMFAALKDEAGQSSIEVQPATLGQIKTQLNEMYGTKFASMLKTCMVLVDDQPSDDNTHIGDNSTVVFLPPVSGG